MKSRFSRVMHRLCVGTVFFTTPVPIGSDRLEGHICKYAKKSYVYKYDLGHILLCSWWKWLLYRVSCIERERERERSLPPSCNRRRVWWRRGQEVVASVFFFDIVFLSYSVFCSPWAIVVFPTIVGFPRYILCLNFVFSIFCIFRAYILVSVVAERTRESNPINLLVCLLLFFSAFIFFLCGRFCLFFYDYILASSCFFLLLLFSSLCPFFLYSFYSFT